MTDPIKQGARGAEGAARSAASNPLLIGLARVGLVSYGIVHVLVAYIALKIAWGGSAQSGDQSGALSTLADDPAGRVLLWIIAVGLFALILWQLSQAIWGYQGEEDRKKLRHRLTAAAKGVVFAALMITAIKSATGGAPSTAAQQQQRTSGVMSLPFGQFLVIVIALIVIAVGVTQIVQGFNKKFMKQIDKSMSAQMHSAVEKAGVTGYISRGIALVVSGGLVGYAALTFDPAKARGLDGAFRLIATAPFGRILLTLVAIGFVAYGLFQFARARYENL